MIIIKYLKWDNWFSYGKDNIIKFSDSVLNQIKGPNGSGKTSIHLILEETLFGKNSKGIKKQALINRNIKNAQLYSEVGFSVDSNDYVVILKRKATIQIQLLKNGEDISSHTATNTYKTIQNIFNLDFKTFSQLLYQSSTSNLEFLQATDSNRKKFLINLYNLNIYLDIHEKIKSAVNSTNTQIQVLTGKINTIEEWARKNKRETLTKKEKLEIPKINKKDIEELADLKAKHVSIKKINKDINDKLTFKEQLNSLDTSILSESLIPPKNIEELNNKVQNLKKKKIEKTTIISQRKTEINKINNLDSQCPTCLQTIEQDFKEELINDRQKEIDLLEKEIYECSMSIKDIEKLLIDANIILRRIEERNKVETEVTKLMSSINEEIPDEIIIETELLENINNLSEKINTITEEIQKISKYNAEVDTHNSKVSVILSQLEEYNEQLKSVRKNLEKEELLYNRLNILKKAFGPSGLPNYKIDYLVSDLEKEINNYLIDLSQGKFQFEFTLKDDKLNITIFDDGINIGIEELSAGELARINAATLLAIRKQMMVFSSTKINILFLDEIMGVLDTDGKEKLVEILYKENDLNTFLVSHEYSHPLIPQINIVKTNKISRIENG